MSLIEPRTLKGFRDYLPEVMIPRERCMELARQVFRLYGFAPIDTPALEYLEVLTGKGSEETDRQLYRFEDHGGRQVGMRFDLTVPLARFTAQHLAQLGLPFRRYHIAPVWRGENTQAGRYREFMQCDFDTIGTSSVASDIETVLVIHELLLTLGFSRFSIRINSRQILQGLLQRWGTAEQSTAVLRALDKLAKVGEAKVREELQQASLNDSQIQSVLELAALQGNDPDVLRALDRLADGQEQALAGIERLSTILNAARRCGVTAERLRIDVSIARGLDYYTGVVFETMLDDLPNIGSICSGGRYDNLAGLYTREHLPGVGASLGLDRLLAAMEQLGMLPPVRTPAPIFVAYFDAERLTDYLQLASAVRAAGIGAELYPEPKKLGQQLKYADHRGFVVGLIAGSRELEQGIVQVKNLRHKIGTEVAWRPGDNEALLHAIRNQLQLDSHIASDS
jgi:histidyl-tRNA synthetase